MNRAICAPCGGLMNHVRWLTLLSNEFVWVPEKAKFITSLIYPKNRSALTWLLHEHKFRDLGQFQNLLFVSHNINDCLTLETPRKILILTCDPNLNLHHYLKFNITLNGLIQQAVVDSTMTLDEIKQSYVVSVMNNNYHNTLYSINNSDIININIDVLYKDRELNVDTYKSIVDFFEISYEYESANEVHKIWYDSQRQGEKLMIDLFKNNIELETYKKLSRQQLTQDDYDIALKLIKEIYGE